MNRTSGFTLIELLIGIALTTLALGFVTLFTLDISGFGTDLNTRLETERELDMTLRAMISEIRSMGPGENGAYPVATATGTTLTFFSDIDNDGSFEQVRYFLDGTTLKKGITEATGTEPAQYPPANEVTSEVVHWLVPGTIFTYYAAGLPSEIGPLPSPTDVAKIRLITITGTTDQDPTKPPLPSTLSITVTIRNLRGDI
ncbi:MAG: type II secretion system protein [Candidatus Yanofskybacteria bacterium]|nr:type II secretion system protein [Candidatus Yanofskybacteria bacterium]